MTDAVVDVAAGLRQEWPRVALGIVFVCVGVGALLVTLPRWRARDPLLPWFGAFGVVYGSRLLVQTEWFQLVSGLDPGVRAHVDSLLLALVPVPAAGFFAQLLGRGLHALPQGVWPLLLGQAALAVVAQAVTGVRYAAVQVTGWSVAVAAGLGAAALRRVWTALPAELRTLAVVFVTYAALGAAGLISGALVPRRQQSTAAVFAALVVSLAWLVTRRVLTNERRLATIENELDAARRIQSALLPRELPRLAGLELAVAYRPMTAVAGDLYAFLPVDDRRLGVLVADVSGHGVGAALIASLVKANVAAQAAHAASASAVLTGLNESLRESLDGSFVTAVYAFVDLEASGVTLASAGHPPLLLCRRGSAVRELSENGLPLGLFAAGQYTETHFGVEPGDRLLLYTDGVVEAESGSGEPYGAVRLSCFLEEHRGLAPAAFLAGLLAELGEWIGRPRAGFADDVTLLVLDLRAG